MVLPSSSSSEYWPFEIIASQQIIDNSVLILNLPSSHLLWDEAESRKKLPRILPSFASLVSVDNGLGFKWSQKYWLWCQQSSWASAISHIGSVRPHHLYNTALSDIPRQCFAQIWDSRLTILSKADSQSSQRTVEILTAFCYYLIWSIMSNPPWSMQFLACINSILESFSSQSRAWSVYTAYLMVCF